MSVNFYSPTRQSDIKIKTQFAQVQNNIDPDDADINRQADEAERVIYSQTSPFSYENTLLEFSRSAARFSRSGRAVTSKEINVLAIELKKKLSSTAPQKLSDLRVMVDQKRLSPDLYEAATAAAKFAGTAEHSSVTGYIEGSVTGRQVDDMLKAVNAAIVKFGKNGKANIPDVTRK